MRAVICDVSTAWMQATLRSYLSYLGFVNDLPRRVPACVAILLPGVCQQPTPLCTSPRFHNFTDYCRKLPGVDNGGYGGWGGAKSCGSNDAGFLPETINISLRTVFLHINYSESSWVKEAGTAACTMPFNVWLKKKDVE